MNSNNIFPIFKIISKTEFEEVKFLKDKAEIHYFKATILPDFNFILDMINDFETYWEISSEKEFETIKSKI